MRWKEQIFPSLLDAIRIAISKVSQLKFCQEDDTNYLQKIRKNYLWIPNTESAKGIARRSNIIFLILHSQLLQRFRDDFHLLLTRNSVTSSHKAFQRTRANFLCQKEAKYLLLSAYINNRIYRARSRDFLKRRETPVETKGMHKLDSAKIQREAELLFAYGMVGTIFLQYRAIKGRVQRDREERRRNEIPSTYENTLENNLTAVYVRR